MNKEYLNSQSACNSEILHENEKHIAIIEELLSVYRKTLLFVTFNLPYSYKNSPLARKCFKESIKDIQRDLLFTPILVKQTESVTGFAAYFLFDNSAIDLKCRIVEIEENHPLSSILEFIVLTNDGDKVSRSDVGINQRKCFVCDNPMLQGSRCKTYDSQETERNILDAMKAYHCAICCEHTVSSAIRALISEVATTPKPGLVDRNNNGSHSDMDFFTFIDSTTSLLPFFHNCTKAGYYHEGSPEELFLSLRRFGVSAEKKMMDATQSVNTHKGAIFSLGLISAAYGVLLANKYESNINHLFTYCSEMAQLVLKDFDAVSIANAHTNGEQVFIQQGITGIRGEAADGYPSVRLYGLQTLQKMLDDGLSLNDAGVITLMTLMAHVDDTNIIRRSNLQTFRQLQNSIKVFLTTNPSHKSVLREANRLDEECIRKNISAGGCADLLAVTYFVHFIHSS